MITPQEKNRRGFMFEEEVKESGEHQPRYVMKGVAGTGGQSNEVVVSPDYDTN